MPRKALIILNTSIAICDEITTASGMLLKKSRMAHGLTTAELVRKKAVALS